jgi:Tetratricopeptide repeat
MVPIRDYMRGTKEVRKAQAEFDRLRASLGDSDPSTLSAAMHLADEYIRCKDPESARKVLEQSLAAYGPWDGDECYDILRVAHRLGYLRSGLGSLDSAREIQERVLTTFR